MKRATVFTKTRYNIDNISIHALVKRATKSVIQTNGGYGISIHALVKRATGLRASALALRGISIHALVKRATQSALDGGLCFWISILSPS